MCVNVCVCVCVCVCIYTAVTVKLVNKPIASTVLLLTPQAAARLLFVTVAALCLLGSPVKEARVHALLLTAAPSVAAHSRAADCQQQRTWSREGGRSSHSPVMDTGCSCWGCYEHACTSLCEDVCISFSWVTTHNVMAEL